MAGRARPLELLKVIGPLTDPTAHGGHAEDAFHLVLPTYPGYGFSGKPQATGWGPDRMAGAFHELMLRLGYKQYVAQGGDWGAIISRGDGGSGAGGAPRDPHQHAWNRPPERPEAHPQSRSGALELLRGGEGGVRRGWSISTGRGPAMPR